MIIFWKNCSDTAPTATDKTLSYSIGVVFLLLFVASVILNLLSFILQCLKKATVYRRLFKLLAITDLLTSLIYPLYAAYMSLKPEPLPSFAQIGTAEAMMLKLGSIPIYLSVVLTSLLSISRYIGVRDPLSVQRVQLFRDTCLTLLLIGVYSLAHLLFLSFSMTNSTGSLYRGAGLTVYFWDVTLLANSTTAAQPPVIPPGQSNVKKLTLASIILWLPAQLHCLIGFMTSVGTIFILNSRKNKKLLTEKCAPAPAALRASQSNTRVGTNGLADPSKRQLCKSKSSPIIATFHQRSAGISPTLRLCVISKTSCSDVNLNGSMNNDGPTTVNNRRGAVTILLMNIGNVVWFVNFFVVLLIEFRRDFFGFMFLDSARFMGRLFVPQVLALLNPSIVILRSTDLRDSFSRHRNNCWSRVRQLAQSSITLTSEHQRQSASVNFMLQ